MTLRMKLYGTPLSGHAHRIVLALSFLGLKAEIVNVNLREGEHHADAFRAINPEGKVPVLVDGDVTIYESTAILTYLGTKYDDGTWLPRDPVLLAEVQKWFIWSASELAPGAARARITKLFGAPFDLVVAQEIGRAFLEKLNRSLDGRDFLVGDRATFADVAIYSYVAHAPEGGLPLEPYPHVQAWISRFEQLDGFVPMPKTPAVAA
ncbi:glutathione S-transferase family protein [Kordiimonas sp.]|uniref:glutathione S-transferase family protein n=1 Tax=Kordiimonas sp. TaxID=1970157 RepID=UPI003A8F4815